MDKQAITEEMHLEKEWFEQASKIRTTDELVPFIDHVLNDYIHDYGTACHAVSACTLAAAWVGCGREGLTGFQAGFVMWDFIMNWTKKGNKCGLKLVDYDDFLYPQYAEKFDKTIKSEVWTSIQEEARKNLEDCRHCAPNVVAHWQSIVQGNVPFGFRVVDD